MEEEIRTHLEMAADDYRREGIDADDALHLARRNFGGVEQTKERYRDLYRFAGIEAFLHDVRFGLGTLRKSPGFSAVAIAMLALGIGINAAVFTIVNAALFKGWPLVERNDHIVQITTSKGVSYADLVAWRSQAKSFKGEMALLRGTFHTLADGAGMPESYFATEVTSNIFQVLGVRPILGRDFLPSDEETGAEPVIIIRYNVWVRQFGANPAVIGHTVRVDGAPARIVGVMPKGFSFPHPMVQNLWIPMAPPPGASERQTPWGGPYAFARLRDGVSVEKARTEMETIGRRLESAYPATNRGLIPVVKSFDEWFVGGDARMLYKVMWGAVCFVLMIVCGNVANLLVERAMGRSHEISLRLALGAGRRRIIRQFLAESLTLATLGGAIGWWIAKVCVRIYVLAQVNEDVLNFAMDRRVAMWLIAISVGAGLLTGISSASYLTKLNIHAVIRDDAQGIAGGRRGARLSRIFVGAEMVLAVVLLASAGVIVRSFLNVYNADVGVNTANILAISNPDLQPKRYPTAATWVPYYRDLLRRLEALPGVESVGLGAMPAIDFQPGAYELADARVVEEESRPTVANSEVSVGYFRTLGIRVLSGREFNDSDGVRVPPSRS